MLSQAYIQEQSELHAREALASGIEPYRPHDIYEVNTWFDIPIPFPVLGDYMPRGYELVETLFCDSTGLGLDYQEPALTQRGLIQYVKDNINNDYSYGIGDIGQFQLYVNVYIFVGT